MKTCRTCETEKSLDSFSKDRGNTDGHNSECRECQKNRYAALSPADKEIRKAKTRAWDVAHPTDSTERAARWTRNNPEKASASQKRWYDEGGKLVQRETRLLREYGLSALAFDVLFTAQGHVCKICGTDNPGKYSWHVDHEHTDRTGLSPDERRRLVRGILCHGCNVGLGSFKDSPERLRGAAAYLEGFASRRL